MIHQLREEGLSVSAIARRAGMDRKTVRKYLKAGLKAPSYGPRAPLLDPYRSYLRERVTSYPGLRATRLLREIRALGYSGGYSQLTAYVRTIRPPAQPGFEHRFETAPGEQVQVATCLPRRMFSTLVQVFWKPSQKRLLLAKPI